MDFEAIRPPVNPGKMKTNVRRVGYACAVILANPDWLHMVIGSGIVVIAVIIHGWAAGYLAREGNKNREDVALTVSGPYRHNRNPFYVSHFLLDFGFFVLAGLPLYFLIYFPFIFSVYRYFVVHKEEPFLEQQFGEPFQEYKQKVPRWGIRLLPATGIGRSESFDWLDYWHNREFSRTVNHLLLMGFFWLIYFQYIPMSQFSLRGRLLVLALYCTWILVHDFHPREREGILWSWLLAGLVIAGGLSYLIWNQPEIWQSMTQPWTRWLLIPGVLLLLLDAGLGLVPLSEKVEQFYETNFTHPLVFWMIFGMSLGFILQLPGILWGTIAACVFLWFLKISNLFVLPPLRTYFPGYLSLAGVLLTVAVYLGF